MKEHPVPQQISAFQFKLFGNLTLRQFIFVGLGGLLAWVIITAIRPPWISWPIGLVVFAIGLAGGLVPLEGRSLDQWLIAFISAIFSPTLRVYRKEQKIPDFLQIQPTGPILASLTSFAQTEKRLRLEEYLKRLPTQSKNQLDLLEEQRLMALNFAAPAPPSIAKLVQSFPQTRTEEPFLVFGLGQKEEARTNKTLGPQLASAINFASSPPIAIQTPTRQLTYLVGLGQTRVRRLGSFTDFSPTAAPLKREKIIEPSLVLKKRFGLPTNGQAPDDLFEYSPKPVSEVTSLSKNEPRVEPSSSNQNVQPKPQAVLPQTPTVQTILEPPALPFQPAAIQEFPPSSKSTDEETQTLEKPTAASIPNQPIPVAPSPPPLSTQLPSEQKFSPPPPPQIPSQTIPQTFVQKPQSEETKATTPVVPSTVQKPQVEAQSPPVQKITQSPAPTAEPPMETPKMPALTHIPNILNGVVTSQEGGLLEETIILVKDQQGMPVRALKTNKLGQFVISTPLPNGTYTIEAEKEGHTFDIIKVEIKGEKVPPVIICAK